MSEREEGFWWVRFARGLHGGGYGLLAYKGGTRSAAIWFDDDGDPECGVIYHSAVEDWGPYIGKAPGRRLDWGCTCDANGPVFEQDGVAVCSSCNSSEAMPAWAKSGG